MIMRRRRKHHPKVVRYRSNPQFRWTIAGYYVGGKRVRKFFKTQDEAERFIHRLEITTENLGTRATLIDQGLHVMAIECTDHLAPYGKTVADATHFYLKHLNTMQRSCTINELIPVFIESTEDDGVGHLYLRDLRYRLKRFGEDFGNQIIATITNPQCSQWLKTIPYAPGSRNAFRRVLKRFLAYAVSEGYCGENPMANTTKARETDEPVEILTPKQLEDLL